RAHASGRPLPQPALSDRSARRPARRDAQSAALRVELPRPALRLGLLHLPHLRQPLVTRTRPAPDELRRRSAAGLGRTAEGKTGLHALAGESKKPKSVCTVCTLSASCERRAPTFRGRCPDSVTGASPLRARRILRCCRHRGRKESP